jgi:hypothetical protein
MFWMCAYPLLGQVGGGLALEISRFFGPKWLSPIGHFTGPKKLLIFRAQPLPTCPRTGYASIQHIMHGAVFIGA